MAQGHPKRGQGISRLSLRGAEVSPQGIPVPHQPPKPQPMADLLGQPPARPLFTQLLLLQVSPALLPIPHPLPNQYGVRDWELAMSTDCKPTDLFYFLQPVLGSVIISLGQGCTGDSMGRPRKTLGTFPLESPSLWLLCPTFLTSPVRGMQLFDISVLGVKTSLCLLRAEIIFGIQPALGWNPDTSQRSQLGESASL